MTNSLASSRKAWKAIQMLIGRVIYGGRYNELGGGDFIKFDSVTNEDYPFKVTRTGNTIRFTSGLVQIPGTIATGRSWIITDNGGYTYTPGTPLYLYVGIKVSSGTPFYTDDGLGNGYVVKPVQPITLDIYTSAGGDYKSATTITLDAARYRPLALSSDAPTKEVKVPICYITDDKTVQLLTGNISIAQYAAHRNLYVWR